MLALGKSSSRPGPRLSVDAALVDLVVGLGVEIAFAVPGGPVAPFYHRVWDDPRVRLVTTRTENGAVMQGIGAARMTGRPVMVITTCGPGILGTRQALEIARSEGVRMVVVSPRLAAAERGRGAPQDGRISADYLLSGQVFDHVAVIESPSELAPLATELAVGMASPGGYLAHVIVSSDLFAAPAPALSVPVFRRAELAASAAVVDEIVDLLFQHRFFILAGRGAHDVAELVRALAEVTGSPVVTTPGGKGVLDERNPSCIGVCGIGGRGDVVGALRRYRPELALILGTRRGGASVSRHLLALPTAGIVQVDRNLRAAGPADAGATVAVQSELRPFLEAVLALSDRLVRRPAMLPPSSTSTLTAPPASAGLVRPAALMVAVQEVIVDGTDAPVLVDVGTAWPWATSLLTFSEPRRFHLETLVGCMGLAVSGAVGGAIGRRGKVVAITGDWSFDMQLPELRAAVDEHALVVFIVLQNCGGQMVRDGDREVYGRSQTGGFHAGDLAGAAALLGAGAARVTAEADLVPALRQAMAAAGPYLVEVWVDTTEMPPYSERFDALRRRGCDD